MPVFLLQGTVRLMDFHCLLLLFINLGEFETLLPFLCSPFPAHLSQPQVFGAYKTHRFTTINLILIGGKHMGLTPHIK